MTITAVCKGFTLVCVYIWAVRPSLNYTGHGHCLSLELDVFRLFLTEHSLPRGFWGHKDVGFFLALSPEEWVSGCWCGLFFQLPFLAYFVTLFLPEEGLTIWLLAEMTLTTAMPTWRSWPRLPKGLCFSEDILKVPTLSFQIPKGYLKWNKKQEFSSWLLQYAGNQKNPLEKGNTTHSSILA